LEVVVGVGGRLSDGKFPSLNLPQSHHDGILPSPLRGITDNAIFVWAIYESGITCDAIAQI